ncbi:MAG: hypothetical protein ACOC1I_05280 [Spirochaetota bacterium]
MGHVTRFPRLVAETLSGRTLVLPDSLDDEVAVVMLVFRRHAQSIVDSWMMPLERRYRDASGLAWYEVPMLAGGWRMISGFIDGGMRSGIHPSRHGNVATYYGDSSRFQDVLGIEDLDSAYTFLINSEGAVLHRGDGWADPRKLHAFYDAVDAALAGNR